VIWGSKSEELPDREQLIQMAPAMLREQKYQA
jgi:hypothetical protein